MRRFLVFSIAVCFAATGFGDQNRPLLERYCTGCHNEKLKTGGLSLERLDPAHPERDAEVWEKVIWKLEAGLMPPAGIARPDVPAVKQFLSSVESEIDQAAALHPNAGRVGLHRLNRTEYSNAVRDLLGLETDAISYLPPDDISHYFDDGEIGEMSPGVMQSYLNASARISLDAIGDAHMNPAERTYHVESAFSQRDHVDGTPLGTRGGIAVTHVFRAGGEYQFKVSFQMAEQGVLWGETLGRGEQLEIGIDGQRVALLDVDPKITENNNSLTTPRIRIDAGAHVIAAAFLRSSDAPNGDLLQQHERSIVDFSAGMTLGVTTLPHLKDFAIVGPFGASAPGPTQSRQRIFVCVPNSPADELPCAREILTRLGRRAYRRPVTQDDLDPLLAIYRETRARGDFEDGIRSALQAMLAFPDFVFRIERPPQGIPPDSNFRISDLELASRLSFFLWRSVPDDTLIDLASRNKLSLPATLERQVKRMLADPRSRSLATSFAEQWLGIRALNHMRPDVSMFPDFDDNLAQAMLRQSDLFFDSIVRENRSVLDLLTAPDTFVNERLARYYGIADVAGPRFRRVKLNDPNRFGVLGQAAVLTATSTPNRTSPVERGKWVLATLLGVQVPPPPPNIPPLAGNDSGNGPKTVREKLEEHRRNEPCASCHRIMDPIGFSLENFDAVGAWRIHDSGEQIDPAGEMYDGTKLDGPASLQHAILNHSGLFVQNLTVKLLTYALGRGVEYYDMPAVRAIDREAAAQDYRFESIILGIVRSAPFEMSRTSPPER